ncbi:MAG TPA: hypothetical protein VMJ12_05510 [Candidatus Acidoferrales bacterium]|nr:hypothetical protein [Candidatus Acidoferrales bacterium]
MKDFHLHECWVSRNPNLSFEGNGGEICAGIRYPFNPGNRVMTFSE